MQKTLNVKQFYDSFISKEYDYQITLKYKIDVNLVKLGDKEKVIEYLIPVY